MKPLKTFHVSKIENLDQVSNFLIKEILPLHSVLSFEADLGAGKTTLISRIINKLGEKETSSPTYTIVNEYQVSLGKAYHFDFYRLKSAEEALDFGWLEYLDSGNVCFLEWASKICAYMPDQYVSIKIEVKEDTSRIFSVFQNGI